MKWSELVIEANRHIDKHGDTQVMILNGPVINTNVTTVPLHSAVTGNDYGLLALATAEEKDKLLNKGLTN